MRSTCTVLLYSLYPNRVPGRVVLRCAPKTMAPPRPQHSRTPFGELPTNCGPIMCTAACGLPADGDENLPPQSDVVSDLVGPCPIYFFIYVLDCSFYCFVPSILTVYDFLRVGVFMSVCNFFFFETQSLAFVTPGVCH